MKKVTVVKSVLCVLSLFFIITVGQAQSTQNIECFKACCTKGKSIKKEKQTPLLNNYDVKFYHLDISVERTSIDIQGNATILAEVLSASLDTFAFELIDALTIDSVLINGVNSSFTHNNDEVFVSVSPSINQGNIINTVVYYGGTPSSGGFFSGISNGFSQSWGNQVTWTLSEPFNAKQWFPCKQVLSDKADSVYVFVTTSDDNKVGSNGLLENVVPLPNNKVRYEWKSRYPINYYLISIAVGEYVEYNIYANPTGLGDSILIQNYIYNNPQTLPFFKTQIDLTADFIELFSDLFGYYPFWEEKYGHSMAPINGGMEHQTMTTQGFFTFNLTSHELMHQWFGNNVTCATWSDIWINEGFASYGEYIARQYLDPGTEYQWISDAHNLITSEPGGSVYVPVNEANNENRIFNGRLSYKKGAAIIHMLRFELQDDTLFFNILKAFQIQYKDSVATGDDFKELAESLSGKNFDYFFDQWYYGEGHPLFNIVWMPLNDSLYISSAQTPSTFAAGLFKMLLPFRVYTPNGDTTIILEQNQANENFVIPFSMQVDSVKVDPEKWMLKVVNSIVQGVSETHPQLQSFLTYPNPTTENLWIQFSNTEMRTIGIYDNQGRLIDEYNTDKTVVQINTQKYASGMYFIKALGQTQTYKEGKFLIH